MRRGILIAICLSALIAPSAPAYALLRTVALSGQQAPGTPSGVLYDDFDEPRINDLGVVSFAGLLQTGGGVTLNNDSGVWTEGTGSFQLLAREGYQAPGGPAGANFNRLFSSSLSDAGVALLANLRTGSGGVVSGNDFGVWAERNGSLQLIAREGAQVPGMPPGVNFNTGNTFSGILQNRYGQVAFPASTTAGQRFGHEEKTTRRKSLAALRSASEAKR